MIDIIVPVMKRPQNAQPFMESLRATVYPGKTNVVAIAGVDDTATMDAWEAVNEWVVPCDKQPGSFGQRVNFGYRLTGGAWLLITGDDVRFHLGWYEASVHCIEQSGCKVIGTNDLGRAVSGDHATHLLIEREYITNLGASWDGPGVVCHEGYRHSYVDDEIIRVARQRGTWAPCLAAVVEHMHPGWGKSPHDETYAIGGAAFQRDGELYLQRVAQYA